MVVFWTMPLYFAETSETQVCGLNQSLLLGWVDFLKIIWWSWIDLYMIVYVLYIHNVCIYILFYITYIIWHMMTRFPPLPAGRDPIRRAVRLYNWAPCSAVIGLGLMGWPWKMMKLSAKSSVKPSVIFKDYGIIPQWYYDRWILWYTNETNGLQPNCLVFFKADTAECYDSGNIPSIFHGIYGWYSWFVIASGDKSYYYQDLW